MRSPITTHVLDTATGRPAAGCPISLSKSGTVIASGITNADGRIADLLEPGTLVPGRYCMTFDTAAYFAQTKTEAFYPVVPVHFVITAIDEHYHVPLLLSPYGYSTYRGS